MSKERVLELVSRLNPKPAMADVVYISNPHLIAHCLAQIPEPGPSYYGRLKFAGQDLWAKDAAIALSISILDKLKGYKTPKNRIGHNMIGRICQSAIWEHLGNSLCPTCNGKGDFINGNLKLVCLTCEGFGTVSISHERHKAFEMDVFEWEKWNPIYIKALEILDKWEVLILKTIKNNFGKHFLSE